MAIRTDVLLADILITAEQLNESRRTAGSFARAHIQCAPICFEGVAR
ncbi:hypothetical protein [Nocardia sp. NPDC004711]